MSRSQKYQINPLTTEYDLPVALNSPFNNEVPAIAIAAAEEVQIQLKTHFSNLPQYQSRMYGVLVVQDEKGTVGYLATYSGSIADIPKEQKKFIPSQFNTADKDHFLSIGLTKLSDLSQKIKLLENENNSPEILTLKDERKSLSQHLQLELFKQYFFTNLYGNHKKLLHIFQDYSGKKPPAGAGECAAPKLLQYAYTHDLKPLAIAEFWWGNSTPSQGRIHKQFYPACEEKCRPILSYMLGI